MVITPYIIILTTTTITTITTMPSQRILLSVIYKQIGEGLILEPVIRAEFWQTDKDTVVDGRVVIPELRESHFGTYTCVCYDREGRCYHYQYILKQMIHAHHPASIEPHYTSANRTVHTSVV